MSNAKENEDESGTQPVPKPSEKDDPITADAKKLPVEQLSHSSLPPATDPNPSAPQPMDEDKPILPENGNRPPPTEAASLNDNAELESTTQKPHKHSPSPPPLPEDESLVEPQIEPATDDKPEAIVTPHAKSETMPGNGTEMSKSEILAGNRADYEITKSEKPADNGTDSEIPKSETSAGNGTDSGIPKSETSAGTGIDARMPKSEISAGNVADSGIPKSETSAGNGIDSGIPKSESFAVNATDSEIPKSETSAATESEVSKSGTFAANGTEICESKKSPGNVKDISLSKTPIVKGAGIPTPQLESSKPVSEAKSEHSEVPENESGGNADTVGNKLDEPATPLVGSSKIKAEVEKARGSNYGKTNLDMPTPKTNGNSGSVRSFLSDDRHNGSESGTEEEQLAFMKELDNFFRERNMEFKPPKFYGEGLNCLKLWRAVMRLGGYDKVTSCKLWRQVGESFKPPKTCTTVSWTFRGFYEKALLDYERHKTLGSELDMPVASNSEPMHVDNQASGSGRARRDAAARAMQGWHEQRLLGHGEVSYPIVKDKNPISSQKREKQMKSLGLLKRKKPSYMEDAVKAARTKSSKSQLDVDVVDIGPPADWVKINVQRTKDCFEVYALVPGLLREEVRVQSDPAGRLVISGEPEHPDNPWGVTPFKKVVGLPSRIDPHQTSAVVTLHGQLLVRVPFEQSD